MSHCRIVALACLYLIFISFGAAGPASAIPGICLDRTPAPPNAALNDGTDSVIFNFNVDHLTTCTSYLTEIIDPGGLVIFSQVLPCLPKPTGFTWPVPLGAQAGCYYARVTFFSDWCAGFPNKFEDQATTGFLVKPCVPVTVCKWEDINGDGIRQPGEPFLPGWTFRFERPLGVVIEEVTTGPNGCVTVCIPVEPNGSTIYFIREIVQAGWVQTFPATNPFQVSLTPGVPVTFEFGNWRPILITGFKYLDQAPWPWTSPHYVGPSGQQNPPEWEPAPDPFCIPPFPANCFSPDHLQPDPTPIPGVVVNLWNAAHTQLLATTVTNGIGKFTFGPINFQNQFIIEEENPLPDPPDCDTQPAEGGLPPWPGEYVSTVAQSVWPSFCGAPCPAKNQDFVNPDRLCISLPAPTVVQQEYGCNYFFNWHPGRLWGLICPQTLELQQQPNDPLPSSTIVVEKIVDAVANPWPAGNPSWDPVTGFYQVDVIAPQEPEGLRQGLYRLTPPQPTDPDAVWQVTLYCNGDCQTAGQTFDLLTPSLEVLVPPGCDVRVDFCLTITRNETRCFLPVTFTQQGWHNYCDINSPVIPGGMIYTKFPVAFKNFTFFGTPYTNKLLVGKTKTITFEGTTGGLNRLCIFLPQAGPCGKLDTSYLNPWAPTSAGALAGEAVALQMNIAYNDRRLMPRTPGYDLELFTVAKGLFKGKTVGQVMVIADRVLSGEPPTMFGVPDCAALVDILQQINANYEFVDMQTFNDGGYLIPNQPLGQAGPGHDPSTP